MFFSARAHVRALMTQKLYAVGMRNAKLRNHLTQLDYELEISIA